MLGYLVGLGDRHGENILLDTDSGRLDDEQEVNSCDCQGLLDQSLQD